MCGACGKTVVFDEVLGPQRGLRQQMIVAQTVNPICAAVQGAPRVRVAGDGWLVQGATGSSTLCHTVEELWKVIFRSCIGNPAQMSAVSAHLRARRHEITEQGLAARVIAVGHQLLSIYGPY